MVVRGSSRTGGGRHYSVCIIAARRRARRDVARLLRSHVSETSSRTARARGRRKIYRRSELWRPRRGARVLAPPTIRSQKFSRALSRACARERRPSCLWRASASGFLPSHPAGRTAAAVGRAVGGDRTSTSRHRLTVRDPRGVSHRGCARDDTRASPRRAAAVVRAARRRGRGRRARSSDPRRVTAFARRTRGGDSAVKSGARRGS